MKKICTIILLLCTVTGLFTGCGSPKQEATETVKAIYDLYILGETTGVSELGISEDDTQAALTAYDDTLKSTIRANFTASGMEISDETLNQICDARKAALAKMDAVYELVSNDKTTAVVKLTTTYFDEAGLDTAAAESTQTEADNAGINDSDEYLSFFGNLYTQKLIEGYNAVTPSEDRKEITVSCVIMDNVWMPEDMSGFGSELGLAVSGQ